MLAHLGKLSHNDNNQRSERIGADTNNSRERFEQSSLNGSPLSVGDVIDRHDLQRFADDYGSTNSTTRLDPDPVSSSTEHAVARQHIKHLLGVSS
jgi:hypothetical protein